MPGDCAATQTRSNPTAMADAPIATGIVRVARQLTGSMRVTVPSMAFATQIAPAPQAMALGPAPTGIVFTTRFVSGSIRETVPSRPFATQTAPPPTVSADGPPPTSIVCRTDFVAGSMRDTEPGTASVLATQTASSPEATPLGAEPTVTSASIVPYFASTMPTLFGATVEACAVPEPPRAVSR